MSDVTNNQFTAKRTVYHDANGDVVTVEHRPDGSAVKTIVHTGFRSPPLDERITLPASVHGWPVEFLGLAGSVVDALRHKGVATLGDLEGRAWRFIYLLKGVNDNRAREIATRLDAAARGSLQPPPPGASPRPIVLALSPGALLTWLLQATRPRQIEIALRYLVARPTQAELGRELKLTGSRVGSLVAAGKFKAKLHLPEAPGWPPILETAGTVLDALTLVSAHGLYELLARRLGWGPASSSEVYALCGLLALHDELVVIRRGEVMAVSRSESAARQRLAILSRADDERIDEYRSALEPDFRDVFERDRVSLLELANR